MPYMQVNANPLNGTPTIYRRGESFYQSEKGALPVTRITSQLEIDAIKADYNKREIYTVGVEQLAPLLGQPASAVKYPPIGDAADDLTVSDSIAAGVHISVADYDGIGTYVYRIGVAGHGGADMLTDKDGSIEVPDTVAGHKLAVGDVLSVTFAMFLGDYDTVDAALTSLEAWEWAQPYKAQTLKA